MKTNKTVAEATIAFLKKSKDERALRYLRTPPLIYAIKKMEGKKIMFTGFAPLIALMLVFAVPYPTAYRIAKGKTVSIQHVQSRRSSPLVTRSSSYTIPQVKIVHFN